MKVRVTITMVREFDANEDNYNIDDGEDWGYDLVAEKEEESFNDDPNAYVEDEVWLQNATYRIEKIGG